MDYGRVLRRAWDIIWAHKYLILLGVLAGLGSGTGGGAATGTGFRFDLPAPDEFRIPEFPAPEVIPPVVGLIGVIVALIILVVVVALWVVGIISRGGLIDSVDTIDGGGLSSFGQAWEAGWRKGWRLVGIALLPAIPVLLLVILAVLAALALYLPAPATPARANVSILAAIAGVLACILVPVAVILGLLEAMANRACMLEDTGVFGSYRRGARVVLDNFGSAFVLFLIQIAIAVGIAIVGILPGMVMAVCCLLWPLLILVQGAITAYFSTMWTLAWRRWTGLASVPEGPLATTQ